MTKFGSTIAGPVAGTIDGILLYAVESWSLSRGRAAAELDYLETHIRGVENGGANAAKSWALTQPPGRGWKILGMVLLSVSSASPAWDASF